MTTFQELLKDIYVCRLECYKGAWGQVLIFINIIVSAMFFLDGQYLKIITSFLTSEILAYITGWIYLGYFGGGDDF
ncbi:MAG: hypothetical protein PUP93_18750 [Rhizonema sp. NSF051]|nr:hypothetical protein [Rhizonema sp. NSF051]